MACTVHHLHRTNAIPRTLNRRSTRYEETHDSLEAITITQPKLLPRNAPAHSPMLTPASLDAREVWLSIIVALAVFLGGVVGLFAMTVIAENL